MTYFVCEHAHRVSLWPPAVESNKVDLLKYCIILRYLY